MEQNTNDSQGASNPILRQANTIQIAVQANVEALGTLLYEETQKTLALQARVRELEALNGLPISDEAIEHYGVHKNRFDREPTEAYVATAWNGKQYKGQLLSYLMSSDNNPAFISQRDATVAATVIQWLASEGGNSFLRFANELTQGRFLQGVLTDE